MKITKYLHSCLLVEEQGKTILFDPGVFTYTEKALSAEKLTNLDYILITHEHEDHMSLPFIHELVSKFPEVKIITNPSIVSLLEKETIKSSSTGDDIVSLEILTHEKLWDKEPPQNAVISIFNKLTHAGDSLHFSKSSDILALPLTAPWGSTTEAVTKALAMGPKVIIPIHDFMWKDAIRIGMYERLQGFFKEKGIDFKSMETGELKEI
jgi:L-ascorbate metabolism protein UlaG (beta-lactamase superfamily)